MIEAVGPPRACPHCRSLRVHRDGRAGGLQHYRCVGCARSFNLWAAVRVAAALQVQNLNTYHSRFKQ